MFIPRDRFIFLLNQFRKYEDELSFIIKKIDKIDDQGTRDLKIKIPLNPVLSNGVWTDQEYIAITMIKFDDITDLRLTKKDLESSTVENKISFRCNNKDYSYIIHDDHYQESLSFKITYSEYDDYQKDKRVLEMKLIELRSRLEKLKKTHPNSIPSDYLNLKF